MTTVSRALNDYSDVSEETKKVIRDAAATLKYFPNSNAQRLATNRSNKIGFIVFGFGKASGEDNFVYELLTGLQHECIKLNYELIFLLGNLVVNEAKNSLEEIFQKYDLAGLVVMGISRNSSFYSDLDKTNRPIVCIDGDVDSKMTANISINNEVAEAEATEYLIEQKQRKSIICLSGIKDSVACQQRLRGYEKVMEQHGLQTMVLFGEYQYDLAYSIIKKIIEDHVTFDGILSANDMMALGAIKALEENDIVVNKDVDVIGFDDILIGSLVKPSLTTIRQDRGQMSKSAIEILNKIIKGESFSNMNLLKHELIIRETA